MTGLPIQPRLSPLVAHRLIQENVLAKARIIETGREDYEAVLKRVTRLGLAGGCIYDALIVQAALKANANTLSTFNGAHFERVWPEAGDRLEILP